MPRSKELDEGDGFVPQKSKNVRLSAGYIDSVVDYGERIAAIRLVSPITRILL
jgi:hypothetical protein